MTRPDSTLKDSITKFLFSTNIAGEVLVPNLSTWPDMTGLMKILDTLLPREKLVLELRFGLTGRSAMTLQEAAEEFCVTRKRIRQIEAKALRKLRHPARRSLLRHWWNGDAEMLKQGLVVLERLMRI